MTMRGRLQGLYLVIDPAPGAAIVLPKVEAALRGGVQVLQVWNHWAEEQDSRDFVCRTLALAARHYVPVLVHERAELLATGAHGIHYDDPRLAPREVHRLARRDVLYGVTCGNDLERVRWAARAGADYVSFCAMFPSPSAASCELVGMQTIGAARQLGDLAIFASGGITPENASQVLEAGADGVAVISGILGAPDPEAAARAYAAVIAARNAAKSRSPAM